MNFSSPSLHHLSASPRPLFVVLGSKPRVPYMLGKDLYQPSYVPSSPLSTRFLAVSHYVAQAGCRRSLILLPQSSKHWGSKHVLPYPASILNYGSVVFCLLSLLYVWQLHKYILNIFLLILLCFSKIVDFFFHIF